MNQTRIQSLDMLASILGIALLASCGREQAPVATTAPPPMSLIPTAISAPERFAGDSDEDEWRKPRAVLEFMGVEPGMHVLDYFAGSGYYSELLSRSVGPSGAVIVYNNPGYAQFAGDKLVKRFENNRLENAKVVTLPTNELKIDADTLDGVLFVMSYHDLYWQPKDAKAPFGNTAQVTADLFQAMKPGGVVVVLDHVANPGGDTAKVVDALHRIDPQVVKNDFTKAGFVFESESPALKHEDDHTKLVFDDSVRHKTDQFIYKFRKPAK
jgi:predicted methyltransferase